MFVVKCKITTDQPEFVARLVSSGRTDDSNLLKALSDVSPRRRRRSSSFLTRRFGPVYLRTVPEIILDSASRRASFLFHSFPVCVCVCICVRFRFSSSPYSRTYESLSLRDVHFSRIAVSSGMSCTSNAAIVYLGLIIETLYGKNLRTLSVYTF